MSDTARLRDDLPPTVAAAMLTHVKLSGPTTTVRDVRALFADEHVHCAVIVEHGKLLAVVERADLDRADDDAIAVDLGRLDGRVSAPDADLYDARHHMLRAGQRRLAVAAADGTFLGLLCLKQRRHGFCSNSDVQSRAGTPGNTFAAVS